MNFIHTLTISILCLGYFYTNLEAVEEIKIGVFIKHRGLEEPLNRSLEMLNADNSVLPSTKLIAIVEIVESDNSYQTSAALCRIISQGVWAIIGPQSIQLTAIIQSITAHYHIPLILINWYPHSYYLKSKSSRREQQMITYENVPNLLNYTVNLYPQSDQLNRAYLDLIRHKGWKSLTFIYDSTEDFQQVRDVFETSFTDTNINIQKISLPYEYPDFEDEQGKDVDGSKTDGGISEKKNDVKYLRYCNFQNNNINMPYRKLMKDLRRKGVENIILSMPLDKICTVLKEASNVGLVTIYNDYIIGNLDIHLLNLTHLQHNMVTNISGFSILDPEGQQTDFTLSKKWLGKRPATFPKKLLSTEYSLMSDAISLIANSLDELLNNPDYAKMTGPTLGCGSNEVWRYGEDFMDSLKGSVRHGGYSGDIRFNKFGQRINFNLDYVFYKNNSFKKVGLWSIEERIKDRSRHSDDFGLQAIKNKTLKVTIARTTLLPYVRYKENYTELIGNERYEGFCIDLLNKLAKKLQFSFVLHEVSDGQYGKIQNGSWNGMVKELLDWKADLAIVDLTITKERQSAVDFTHPFMTLGIAIMYKKPKMEEAEMYSFMMPFSHEVWLSMWSAYVGISLALWFVSRLSPIEWKNPHPCIDNPDEKDLENEIHSIGASLWFTIGSLMQQGSDLAPRSPSVRALGSVWYFFTLILISSYTANFAAFLTASRLLNPIESAEDLSKQTKIDYGCKEGGSTQAFFSSSNHSTYRRMWNYMESKKHQGVFPNDNSKGISMVKKGNFAFLMESTSIEYVVQRDCELTQIGNLLDNKGYGIALRKRSPYRQALSKAIIELNEAGELQDLKNRWWIVENTFCEEEKSSALATSELGINKVGGVFVLLGMGVTIASMTAVLEFIWKTLKLQFDERKPIQTLLWREILRILTCGPSKRPAVNNGMYSRGTQ